MEEENNNEEFFDDWPICRLMKKAKGEGREPTKGVFKGTKEDGAIVVGEWFKIRH
jgi:hypothetical protein